MFLSAVAFLAVVLPGCVTDGLRFQYTLVVVVCDLFRGVHAAITYLDGVSVEYFSELIYLFIYLFYFVLFYFILWDSMSSVSSQLQAMSGIGVQRHEEILKKMGSRSRRSSVADISTSVADILTGKIIL